MVEAEVTFHSGDDELAGVLVLPDGPGPHPVTVFIHGSGSATREGFGLYAPIWSEFSRNGMGSVSWDKPGVGDSTGKFLQQSFEGRSMEVIAAIDFLKQRPDVDSSRIGRWGISQAGWVMPMVCDRAPDDVAFVIGVGIPVGTVAEQERFRITHTLPADGYSAAETEQALAAADLATELLRENASLETANRNLDRFRSERWFELVFGDFDEADYEFGKRIYFYSPVDHLPSVRCPVLAIFGELDTLVDGKQSERVLRELLPKAGNHDLTVKFFPGANHSMVKAVTGGQEEMGRREGNEWEYAEGYLALMSEWLTQRQMSSV
ncbi:MAG: alpha/beta fold hydrolase [Dehalococcoidia bacterium]|nr:alpha/beta fold hydrolase [Dehalococcoidia bacterium]